MKPEHDPQIHHDRLIEIETKLAYQEDLLQSLNQVIIEQASSIDVLQLRLKKLGDQLVNGAGENMNSGVEEAPPHY